MLIFFTVVHVVLCVFMMLVILLQPGKDAGMGAALGGGAATSAFGGRGAATFLTKLTAFCAIAFFLTSLGLSFVGLKTSVADELEAEAPAAPVAPVVPAPADTAPAGSPVGTTPPAEAAPANPTEAAPVPTAAEPAPSANDAVPAQKLPAN